MATTHPTDTLDRATRRATVRRLADEGKSNRAIGRELGIGKDTVARDLAATTATPAPDTAPQDATPAATSGARRAPWLLHDLEPALIQDLNVLTDPRTGALIEPVRRYLRAAARAVRADMESRLTDTEE
jgi:IS30 family transposase